MKKTAGNSVGKTYPTNNVETTQAPSNSPDALITISATLPGFKPTQFNLRIVNFRGNTIGVERTVENFKENMRDFLQKSYGGVIK